MIISDITMFAQKHRTVRHLNLSHNNIQILPYGFVHLGLQSLDLSSNHSLKFPGRNLIANLDRKQTAALLGDFKKGSVPAVYAKLMLVGHGGAGKSTLAKALDMKPADLRNLLKMLKHKAGLV